MRRITYGSASVAMLAGLVVGCNGDGEPDAYGTFEATEVVVSAEAPGRLLRFTPLEGGRVDAGMVVGLVDTTHLVLERDQIAAQRSVVGARTVEVARQIAMLEAEREIARRTYERTQRLHAQQAATSHQLDQAERDYRAVSDRLELAHAQRQTAGGEVRAAEARVAQISERLRKSEIVNPVAGTVLNTYAEPGEFVQPGQALYTIANLDTLTFRAYVTESQLAGLRLGQAVQVSIDVGRDERRVLPGTVRWISAQAEFTPTPIQTRDERADLVYALKIRVVNPEGFAKIGMPADVEFEARAPS